MSTRRVLPGWLGSWMQRLEGWLLVVTLLAIGASPWLRAVPLELQILIVALGVGVLGLPHGATDWRGAFARQGMSHFLLGYVGIAALTVWLWATAPVAWLVVFLVLSALHFGEDPASLPQPPRLAGLDGWVRGAVPLALPLGFWPAESAALFSSLGVGSQFGIRSVLEAASPLLVGAPLLGIAMLLAGAASASSSLGTRGRLDAAHLLVLPLAAFSLPPLLFFALHFCGWHSLRNALVESARLAGPGDVEGLAALRRFARAAWPPTAATLVASTALWWAGPVAGAEGLLRLVFVGLSGLAVAHILIGGLAESEPGRANRLPAASVRGRLSSSGVS